MNEDRYQLFDQYLNNELSLEEKNNFEQQLITDKEIENSFEIFKELNGFMSNKFENEEQLKSFKENLKNVSSQSKLDKKQKMFSIKPIYYTVAACFALIIGLIVFNNSGVPVYQDFRQLEQAQFIERGDVIKDLKLAQDAFNSKKYNEAVPIFEKILKIYPRPEIEYFYGISLLETDKYYESEMVFNKLIIGKSTYKTKAIWNLALLKLKQKDFISCKNILMTIPKDYEDFNQVEKLLESLK